LVVCMRKESDHVHRMRAEADAFEDMDWVSVRDVDRMAAGSPVFVGNSLAFGSPMVTVGVVPFLPALLSVFVREVRVYY
jgi:hypothetical protein